MKFVATYTPSILLSTIFLVFLPSIIHAGTITVDWSEVDCVTTASATDDDMEPCHGKLRTYQGEYLEFINGSGETYLYDNEESWNACCSFNRTLVDSDVFDSWLDDEGPVQGAQYFAVSDALNENCEKRFKAIFHKKKFGRVKSETGKRYSTVKGRAMVTCYATYENVIETKSCHKQCRERKECIGLKLSGRGKIKECTLFSGDMFVENVDGRSFDRCRGLKTKLKNNRQIILGD